MEHPPRRKIHGYEVEHLLEQQGYRCATPWCRADLTRVDYDVDHVCPLTCMGWDALENMQVLCARCNRGKGALTMREFITRRQVLIGLAKSDDEVWSVLLHLKRDLLKQEMVPRTGNQRDKRTDLWYRLHEQQPGIWRHLSRFDREALVRRLAYEGNPEYDPALDGVCRPPITPAGERLPDHNMWGLAFEERTD